MTQTNAADDRAEAIESKFYLPAGTGPSYVASRVESMWAALFDHGVETSR